MPYRILVVEDNPDCREMIALHLKWLGYEPLEAETGEAAIGMALAERPDLIILDLALPGMSGFQTASRLKNDPQTRDIPIVAHTAFPEDEYRSRVAEAGMLALVPKPVSPRVLQATIERCFRSVKAD
ncbi:MAG TPA: response regulator [candidate division Zixibacteria bacterium]|nr:response regulator [candidate division Zixibacteria bacterium]